MSQDIEEVKLSIPAQSEYVAVARLAISGIASRMNYTIDEIDDIKIAVSEACNNAVQHAYDNDVCQNIDITCHIYQDYLEVVVSDQGKGFDPQNAVSEKIENPDVDKFGLGLGMTFIKSLMDEANFESAPGKGSAVRMKKILKHAS